MIGRTRHASTSLFSALMLSLVIAVTVQAAGRAARRSAQDYPPKPGATPILVIVPTTPPVRSSPPSQPSSRPSAPKTAAPLTAAEQVEAMRVALGDPYVTRLIKGRRYRIGKVTLWTGAPGKARGAAVRIVFARQARVKGTWLRLSRSPYRASYARVHALRILVNLRKREVMAITPRFA